MRYAIIADIHSNIEALSIVLKKLDALDAERIICLGDIVGYNANPNECVEMLRERGAVCIMGNHDACAAGVEEPDNFNTDARDALLWTREKLSDENRLFLKGLERKYAVDDGFIAVHGSLSSTNDYIFSGSDVERNFGLLSAEYVPFRIAFFGHTHATAAYALSPSGAVISGGINPVRLDPDSLYLLNPGSVGQPRDGNPNAAFMTYDSEKHEAAFFRTPYDIDSCARKIYKAGLPDMLAKRLPDGR